MEMKLTSPVLPHVTQEEKQIFFVSKYNVTCPYLADALFINLAMHAGLGRADVKT